MGILEGISAARTGIELTKIVRELLRREKLDRTEIEGRIGEIQQYLTDAREALGDALEENRKLRAQIEQLKSEGEMKAAVIPAEGAYWRRKQDGKLDGPFCTVCWDQGSQLVRLLFVNERQHVEHGMRRTYNKCPVHEEVVIKLRSAIFDETNTVS